MTTNYIELNGITKTIKKHAVLEDINLQLDKGGIYGFVGRNGSGKTMLFRIISGLVRPTQGTVIINGKQLGKDISFPENLGLLIENIGMWEWLSGAENLRAITKAGKKLSGDEIKRAIARVGLDPEDKRPVRKYSLGMKQRIALAQALMEAPELIILDEPTNALDENGVKEIRAILLEEQKHGATVLVASHNSEDIKILCDRVFYMDAGKIIKTETTQAFEAGKAARKEDAEDEK